MTPTRGIAGDIRPPSRAVLAARPLPTAPRRPLAPPTPRKRQAASSGRWRLWRDRLQYPLIAAVALGAAYSGGFGQVLLGLYVVYVVLGRRASRVSFGVALFLILTIPLFQGLNQTVIAQNIAMYVFELLAFGTAQAIWEQRKIDKTAN